MAWLKTDGTVIARRETARGPHGIAIRFAYVIDVHPKHGPTFRAEAKDPLFNGNFEWPSPGDKVGLEYNGSKVRFDKSDPRTNRRKIQQAESDAENKRFRAALDKK